MQSPLDLSALEKDLPPLYPPIRYLYDKATFHEFLDTVLKALLDPRLAPFDVHADLYGGEPRVIYTFRVVYALIQALVLTNPGLREPFVERVYEDRSLMLKWDEYSLEFDICAQVWVYQNSIEHTEHELSLHFGQEDTLFSMQNLKDLHDFAMKYAKKL